MYCPSCGIAVTQGLTYCNHCGARVNGAIDQHLTKPSGVALESLVWAIVSVFVVGLGATIGLMAVMKNELNFNVGLIISFTLLSFLLMISVEAVFVWLLLDSRKGSKRAGDLSQIKEPSRTNELGEAQARVLAEPLPSVTEHTTRAFEPIYREQTPK
jgi:hypothetical protein